MQQLIKNKHTN